MIVDYGQWIDANRDKFTYTKDTKPAGPYFIGDLYFDSDENQWMYYEGNGTWERIDTQKVYQIQPAPDNSPCGLKYKSDSNPTITIKINKFENEDNKKP